MMTIKTRKIYTAYLDARKKACAYDNIGTAATCFVFSADNPHVAEYNKAVIALQKAVGGGK